MRKSGSCGTRARKSVRGSCGQSCKRDGCPCQMPYIRALTVFLGLRRLNYGQEEITAKVETAEALGAEIEFSRA